MSKKLSGQELTDRAVHLFDFHLGRDLTGEEIVAVAELVGGLEGRADGPFQATFRADDLTLVEPAPETIEDDQSEVPSGAVELSDAEESVGPECRTNIGLPAVEEAPSTS